MSSGLEDPVCRLEDENLPEITLLDVTCDSALHGSVLATPVTAGSVTSRFLQPSQLTSSTYLNTTAQTTTCPQNRTEDRSQSNANCPKAENDAFSTKAKRNGMKTLLEMTPSDRTSDKENHSEVCSPELSKHNWTATDADDKMVDPPESLYASVHWLDVRYFPEITLLDMTRDSESQVEEIPSVEVTRDFSPVDSLKNNMPPSESSEQTEPGRSDMSQREELSSSSTVTGSVTHTTISFSEQSDKSVAGNTTQTSLEVTQDMSTSSVLENSRPSLEPIGPVVKIQTSAEDTFGTRPANVTHDISSSSDMSVRCAASQLSPSDKPSNTSLKNDTSEPRVEPAVNLNTVEANNEELLPSHDAELTSKEPQPSPKPSGSVNGTFTSLQPSPLSSSTDLNTTAQMPCPHNKTLDLPPSDESSPITESQPTVQSTTVSINTTETSLVMNQNSSAVKASGSCDMPNATFDRHSLQKSSASTILVEADAGTFCLQNNTFDTKPKQNGTITLSESSDSHQSTFDKPSPNATSSPKENNSDVHRPELLKHNGTTDTDPVAKTVDTPESTFEANPAVELSSGAGRRETKDHSQSGLPVTDGLSDSLVRQSMDTQNNKENTFNWDDILDLKPDPLIASTPMTNCKMFNLITQREEGKTLVAQKKLYGDGPSKPDGQMPSDVPSNIICDRKTFLTHPAAKSLLPPSKAASQLFKHRPASALPGRFEALTSGAPMTRQRTQAEALRNTSGDSSQSAGISSSYKLRATTTGFKQPHSGLQRPQLSGIPSGIQRAATGLRLPSVRNTTPASSTNKLRGPTAPYPVTKTSQAKKQPLTRGEALPIAKRKKMDASLPCGSAEASSSSCDAANGNKNLKRPATSKRALPAKTPRDDAAVPACTAAETSCDAVSRAKALKLPATSHRALPPKPKGHGCANCIMLEQQLKMKSEEISRLKEELLKKSKEEEY